MYLIVVRVVMMHSVHKDRVLCCRGSCTYLIVIEAGFGCTVYMEIGYCGCREERCVMKEDV